MKAGAKESIDLVIDKKKNVCHFIFEGRAYEVPMEKCCDTRKKIETEIKAYKEKCKKIIENLYKDAAALGTFIILTTSNGSSPFYDDYRRLKNSIIKILKESSVCVYKLLDYYTE